MENKASLAKEAFIWPLPITSALHDILIGFHQYLISIRPHMPSKFLHLQTFSSSPFSKIPPRPLVWSGCSRLSSRKPSFCRFFCLLFLLVVRTNWFLSVLVYTQSPKTACTEPGRGLVLACWRPWEPARLLHFMWWAMEYHKGVRLSTEPKIINLPKKGGVIKGDRQLFTLYRNIQQVSELDYTLDYAESIDILQGF